MQVYAIPKVIAISIPFKYAKQDDLYSEILNY